LGDVEKDEEEEEERKMGGGSGRREGAIFRDGHLERNFTSSVDFRTWAVRYDSQISRPVAMTFGDPVLLWTEKKYTTSKREGRSCADSNCDLEYKL
jgi:hypothetical protein